MLNRKGIVRAILAGTLLLLGATVTATFNGPEFEPQVTYGVGNNPRAVAMGDLDGDGDLDLVVANWGSDNVSVLLNQGDGTFAGQVTYGVGYDPWAVAVGDLDGDGDPDVVTANWGGNVSVLLNQGDSTLASRVDYGVGSRPHSVAVGDLDADGDLDLVTANYDSNNVSVLLNQGDGTFASQVTYGVGSNPQSVAVGDLDGDGDLDLATANRESGNVSVLLNQGDGTFASQANYGAGYDPWAVAMGDLDGNGDLDLAVGNWSGNVSVLLNQGDGTFASQVTYIGGGNSIAVGDLDGDGDLDLVTAIYPSHNVSVLLNQGNGIFASQVTYDVGNDPCSVALGDLDGDGDLDLAVANWPDHNVSVLLNHHHTPLNILQLQPMNDARIGPGAAMGIDGKIYVFGGGFPGGILASVECYDPATDTWSYRAPMPGPRAWLRAATAPDGTIYTFGGSTDSGPSTEVWAYDPGTDTWDTTVPQMPTPRRDVVAVTGADGLIYVFGGYPNYNTVEAFDPVNKTWHTKAPMPTGRWCAGGALGPDGKIYIVGGGISGQPDGALDSLEVYDPATDSWETKSPMPTGSVGLGAAFGPDGKLYAIGGELYGSGRTGIVYDLIQRYDPLTDSWEIAGNLETGLSTPSAISDAGGIYILGGGYLVENGGEYPYTLVPTNWNQYLEIPSEPISVVWIDPPEKSIYPNSEPFTITVAISDIVNLAGFQFTVTYSPTIVHVEDVVLGDFLGSTGRTANPVDPDIDNEAGTVAFGSYSVGTEPAPDGSGVLATLTLSPQASGESDLHLQDVLSVNTIPETIPVSTQDGHVRVCIFGDFNCDCKVDIVDIMLVAIRWNTFVGDPDYDPIYDLDGDGDIDILDILLVAVHWGETC